MAKRKGVRLSGEFTWKVKRNPMSTHWLWWVWIPRKYKKSG